MKTHYYLYSATLGNIWSIRFHALVEIGSEPGTFNTINYAPRDVLKLSMHCYPLILLECKKQHGDNFNKV